MNKTITEQEFEQFQEQQAKELVFQLLKLTQQYREHLETYYFMGTYRFLSVTVYAGGYRILPTTTKNDIGGPSSDEEVLSAIDSVLSSKDFTSEEEIKLIKYRAIIRLERLLKEDPYSPQERSYNIRKITRFRNGFAEYRSDLAKDSDTVFEKFLKVVLTILSFGIAVPICHLWKTHGEGFNKSIESKLSLPKFKP